jgi:hypothetical protein
LVVIKIVYIFTLNFKTNIMLNTTKINKETLKSLGNLLRNNKGLNKMIIKNGGHEVITDKKEFCKEVLNLLKNNNLLQLAYVQRKGYYGQTTNFDCALKYTDVEEITVSVYVEQTEPLTRWEAMSKGNWGD